MTPTEWEEANAEADRARQAERAWWSAQSKPFVKWVGGKGRLGSLLTPLMPEKYGRYFEPFLGGGAMYFNVGWKTPAFLSDANAELINAYVVVCDRPEELMESLGRHSNTQEYFYRIRAWDREPGYAQCSDVERASRFIYLNKTCFNGLYRVNSAGYYNAPFGKYENPRILDVDMLIRCGAALDGVDIQCQSFEAVQDKAESGDFVYFDPPYDPVTPTASFTSYTAEGFGNDMQERLREMIDKLTERGVLCMVSNSDTLYIRELYAGSRYRIETIEAARAINCNGAGRGKVREVVIRNYGDK